MSGSVSRNVKLLKNQDKPFSTIVKYGPDMLNTDEVRRVKRPYQIITSRDHPAMMYAPDLSKWLFNQMLGMGDMEHNRKLREERENKRPIITNTKQEIALWNIWVYYQKDIMRRLAQQKNAGGGASDDD